jgi:hypothetical protein
MLSVLLLLSSVNADVGALEFDPYQRNWARTDLAVASGEVQRTWMWGPQTNVYQTAERYAESPNGRRIVVYFDKSRMEVTDPEADPESIWYVTNGLLVVELMTGQMQIGHELFEQREPAWVNVAGDGPTYATFAAHRDPVGNEPTGVLTTRIDRWGNLTDDPGLATHQVRNLWYVPDTGHWIAGPFWEFMNSRGLIWDSRQNSYVRDSLFPDPFYATGFPITEAFWASVKLADVYQDVLIQCFERRCLTWTPGNPPGWRVEAGNVGLHYYIWRYGEPPPKPAG